MQSPGHCTLASGHGSQPFNGSGPRHCPNPLRHHRSRMAWRDSGWPLPPRRSSDRTLKHFGWPWSSAHPLKCCPPASTKPTYNPVKTVQKPSKPYPLHIVAQATPASSHQIPRASPSVAQSLTCCHKQIAPPAVAQRPPLPVHMPRPLRSGHLRGPGARTTRAPRDPQRPAGSAGPGHPAPKASSQPFGRSLAYSAVIGIAPCDKGTVRLHRHQRQLRGADIGHLARRNGILKRTSTLKLLYYQ